MTDNKCRSLPAQGCSEPQGPAGVGGVVPAPPPSSSDDGLPSVSWVGTEGALATTPNIDGISVVVSDLTAAMHLADQWWTQLDWQLKREEASDIIPPEKVVTLSIGRARHLSTGIKDMSDRIRKALDHLQTELQLEKREAGVQTMEAGRSDASIDPMPIRARGRWTQTDVQTREQESSSTTERRGGSPALADVVPPMRWPRRGSVDGTPGSNLLRGSGPAGLSYADAVKASARAPGIKIRAPGIGTVRVARDDDGDLLVEVPGIIETEVTTPPRRGDSGWESSPSEGEGRFSPEREKRRRRRVSRRVGRPSAVLPEGGPARCYSCLEAGHIAAQCPSGGESDRGVRCYKCGAPSHKMARCRAGGPRCPLCADLGLPAGHILGAEGCKPPPPGTVRRRRAGGTPLSPGAGRGLPPSKTGGTESQSHGPPDSPLEGWDPGGRGAK